MAKLSDQKLLDEFTKEAMIGCDVCMSPLYEQILDRMPDRMGKVDVAGIAREIGAAVASKLGRGNLMETLKDNGFTQIAETILRSHLEGKSE